MGKRKIWTMGYFPMTMGGSVHQPIVTEIEPIEEKKIGKGLKAFSFKTPKGNLRIAESITGAIVGDSFKEVIADVKVASKKVMMEQIENGKKMLSSGSVKHYSNQKFFQLYKV